jgi:hypothetical protein
MLTGISAKREAVFFGAQKEKRCFWAPKRKAVFDPRALKLLRAPKQPRQKMHRPEGTLRRIHATMTCTNPFIKTSL